MIAFVAKRLLSSLLSEDIPPTSCEVDYNNIQAQIGIKRRGLTKLILGGIFILKHFILIQISVKNVLHRYYFTTIRIWILVSERIFVCCKSRINVNIFTYQAISSCFLVMVLLLYLLYLLLDHLLRSE